MPKSKKGHQVIKSRCRRGPLSWSSEDTPSLENKRYAINLTVLLEMPTKEASWPSVLDYNMRVENWVSESCIDSPGKSVNLGVTDGDGDHWLHPWGVGLLPCSTLVWDLEEIQALRCLWHSVWASGLLSWQGRAGHGGVQAFLIWPLVSRSVGMWHKLGFDDSILMVS